MEPRMNYLKLKSFLKKIENDFEDDYQVFKALLKNVIDISGAKEKFFRNEDNSECNFLKALINYDIDDKKYKGGLRLYCLYYNRDRVILGNGDIKKTRTFNEDNNLKKITKVLQSLDKAMHEREMDGELSWDGMKLYSNKPLIFEIDI